MAAMHLPLLLSLFIVLSSPSALSRLTPSSDISQSPSQPPVSAPIITTTTSFSDQPSLFDELPTSIVSAGIIDFSTSLKAVGHNPLVSKICDNTDHPPLCLATVTPFLGAAHSVDVESVLRFAVEAGQDYAKEALSVAKNLVSKHIVAPELRSTVKDCRDSYDVAVENFQKTMDAFATKDIGTMRSVLSAIITFVGDCEDEFAEMQAPSPLSGYADKLTDMTSNCLAIVSQMMN